MKERNEKLLNGKIGRTLLSLSLPAMVGMLVQALYNVVDTIFIGRGIGTKGIAAISISFPVQMIVLAISLMIGVGTASIISRSHGAGDHKKAEKTLGNAFGLSLAISILLAIVGSIFLEPMLKLFGASDTILPYAIDYLRIILISTVLFSFGIVTNNAVRSEGNAKLAMTTMIVSAVLNMILDPIFIFVLNLGIKGAAYATILAQATTTIYMVFYFVSGKSMTKFHLKNLIPSLKTIGEIISIGLPSFVMQVIGSFLVILLNNLLGFYGGDVYIAVYGIINRVISLFFMPIFGLSQGLQPLAGFNYGAKKYERVIESVMLAIKAATAISTIAFAVIMIFPAGLAGIFTKDTELIKATASSMRIMVIAFPLVGFQIIGSSMFQTIGKALPALLLTLTRQVIFLIPSILILSKIIGLKGIWIASPISDTLSFILTLVVFMAEMKNLKKNILPAYEAA